MKCEVGDIVLINNFKYPDGSDGSLHNFTLNAIICLKKSKKTTFSCALALYPYNNTTDSWNCIKHL